MEKAGFFRDDPDPSDSIRKAMGEQADRGRVVAYLASGELLPRHLEAHFAGSGIDTLGGPFLVTASGCLATQANVLSQLEANDTYLGSGDSIRIDPADAVLDFDPVTCTASTARPLPFDVVGGTSALADARGGGLYNLAFTLPTCLGPQQVVHVWLHGTVDQGRT